MSDSKQKAFEAQYAAKLETQAALQKELAKIDEATNNLKQELVLESDQLKHFKNNVIPKGKKLLNETRKAHESLMTEIERTDKLRTGFSDFLNTNMSTLEEEQRQLEDNIAEQEAEALQLQATIAELKESIVSMQPKAQQTKAEINKAKGLQLIAETRKAELENIETAKKELLKAIKANCIQGNDEIQLLKERYAEANNEQTKSADELKRLREQKEDLDTSKFEPLYLLELLLRERDSVANEAAIREAISKPALEIAKIANANLLAQQRAQHLANDEVIENLTLQLRSVINGVASHERQSSVIRMQSNCESPPKEAEFSITMRSKVHSTPYSQVSSTSSGSPNLSPIFDASQSLEQQQPNIQEIQQHFDNRNSNDRTPLRYLPSHSRSNVQNQKKPE